MNARLRIGFILLALVVATASGAMAQTTYFVPSDDVWNNAANWDNNLPVAGGTAYVGSKSSGKTSPATARIHAGDALAAAIVYLGAGGTAPCGTLIMDGGTLTMTGAFYPGYDSTGTGIVVQTGGVISNLYFRLGYNGQGTWTLAGGVVSNNPSSSYYSYLGENGTGRGDLTISNGARMVGGRINLARYAGARGTLKILSGGTLSGIEELVVGLAGVGTLVVSNAVLDATAKGITVVQADGGTGNVDLYGATVKCGSMTVGSKGPGNLHATAGTFITNAGTLYFGNYTNGVGKMWIDGGARYVGSGEVRLPWQGSGNGLIVSNGSFECANHVQVDYGTLTPGWVELAGTQRVFRVDRLTIGNEGSLTNRIAKFAGGVDVTLTDSYRIAITAPGRIHLLFVDNPVQTGDFWGVRWAGDNRTTLGSFTNGTPARLTWDTSALHPMYQNQVAIYTNAGYTYVGIQVTNLVASSSGKGSLITFR